MFGEDVRDAVKEFVKQCLGCSNQLNKEALDLGYLPACNRFHLGQFENDFFSLSLTECDHCSLIQLVQKPPISFITPRFQWISYQEPEGHLSDVAKKIEHITSKDKINIIGIGPFDQPLINKLSNVGNSQFFNLAGETGPDCFPYLETIQANLTTAKMKSIANDYGLAQLVSCRYLLEHCHDPVEALQSFKCLLADDGYLLLEVPDCTKFINRKDYSFIWEEHVTYFTEISLTHLLNYSGYEIVEFAKYPGYLEDALVVIAKPKQMVSDDYSVKVNKLSNTLTKGQGPRFQAYKNSFSTIEKNYSHLFSKICDKGGKICILGAGHQAMMFIHAFKLAPYISYLLDDNPHKQSFYAPGTTIPITKSSVLLEDQSIDTCLLAINPQIEEKIQHKFAEFLKRGGKMHSIFPGSPSHTLLSAS